MASMRNLVVTPPFAEKPPVFPFAANTRYVLEHAPCRVILGFAPKSIQPQAEPAKESAAPEA